MNTYIKPVVVDYGDLAELTAVSNGQDAQDIAIKSSPINV